MLCIAAGQSAAQASAQAWYETEPGVVAAAGKDIQRRTPRESMRTFVGLSEVGRHGEAAHFLNLSDLLKTARVWRVNWPS